MILDGQPWFAAKDACVCVGLGAHNVSTHLARLDADEKGHSLIVTPGGTQRMSVVSEPGLYALVARSTKPAAKRFDRWVRHEVLPQIMDNGGYVMADAGAPLVSDSRLIQAAGSSCASRRRRDSDGRGGRVA